MYGSIQQDLFAENNLADEKLLNVVPRLDFRASFHEMKRGAEHKPAVGPKGLLPKPSKAGPL